LNSFKITDIESAKEEIVILRKKLNNKRKEISLLKNENIKQNPTNELPVINQLKQQVNDLNSEVTKLRNDSNVKNYTKLENNYILNNKELTQLKQENNMIRFQLENLNRKKKRFHRKKTIILITISSSIQICYLTKSKT
jgi:TolA-binding protein